MTPRVLANVRDDEGTVVDEPEPQRVAPGHVGRDRRDHARGDDRRGRSGTARNLAIPGFEVGGKTGTAQLGTDPPRSHAWIIGFAGPPGRRADRSRSR